MTTNPPQSAWKTVQYWGKRAWQMELAMWLSLFRLLGRRPRVPAGARGFSYHRQVSTILWVFIVLSAIEIPIIDLIVHRWPVIRIVFLALGIWGCTWMIGLAAGYVTRPHSVGRDGIRVRNGAEVEYILDWDAIESVQMALCVDEPKAEVVTEDADGRTTLWQRMQHETNIEVRLEQPIDVELRSGARRIDAIRFWVDEPHDFLAEVRRRVDER